MSKKNNRRYQPRHVKDDAVSAAAEYRPQATASRYLNEENLRMSAETADEPGIAQAKDVSSRKAVAAEQAPEKAAPAEKAINQRIEKAAPAEKTVNNRIEESKTAEKTVNNRIEESKTAEKTVNNRIEKSETAEKASKKRDEKPAPATEKAADSAALSADKKPVNAPAAAAASTAPKAKKKSRSSKAEPKNVAVSKDAENADIKAAAEEVTVSVAPAEAATAEDLEELYAAAPAPSRKSKEKPRKKRRWLRVLIIILCVLLAIVIAAVGTIHVMKLNGRRSLLSKSNNNVEVILPTEDESGNEITTSDQYGRIITYNGTTYVYNNDLIRLTLIGIDDGHNSQKKQKMADAIYVLAINTANGKIKVLNISRDIMTDVDSYSVGGEFLGTEEKQIAYSYSSYGSNMTGGENTNRSISRLLFGMPMNDYFVLNLQGLSTLNDAVGGVTVTSALTFESLEDGHMINKGDKVTLHGQDAEYYARRRDIKELESNNDRMQRQQDYIMAFLGSIVPAVKKDLTIIPDLYNAIRENSTTSLNPSELVYLVTDVATKLKSMSDIQFYKFKGVITAGEYAEMRVTNEEVLKTMLEIFYKPIESKTATVSAVSPTAPAATTALPTEPSVIPTQEATTATVAEG